MLNRIIDLSIRGRWLVLLLVLVLSIFGARELLRLPIDAVPDITNNQVQINAVAPSLDARASMSRHAAILSLLFLPQFRIRVFRICRWRSNSGGYVQGGVHVEHCNNVQKSTVRVLRQFSLQLAVQLVCHL